MSDMADFVKTLGGKLLIQPIGRPTCRDCGAGAKYFISVDYPRDFRTIGIGHACQECASRVQAEVSA